MAVSHALKNIYHNSLKDLGHFPLIAVTPKLINSLFAKQKCTFHIFHNTYLELSQKLEK